MKIKPILLSEAFRQDPEVLYAGLRDQHPVCYAEDLDLYLLSRHADIKDALKNPGISRDPVNSANYTPIAHSDTPHRDAVLVGNPFSDDGARHRKLRRVLIRTFSDRALGELDGVIAAIVRDTAREQLPARGEADLMSFIKPIPMAVIAHILGLDRLGVTSGEFTAIANDFFLGIYSSASRAELEKSERATITLLEMFDELMAATERDKPDNFTHRMLQFSREEHGISNADLKSVIVTLLAAATETTAYQAGFLLHDLLAHPEQWRLLRENRALMSAAIAESTRYNLTSSLAAERYPVTDISYAGTTIPAGATLQLSMQSANNDPAVFDQPRRFDIQRAHNDAIPFGHGQHMCIGIHLARAEIACIVNEVLDRLPAPVPADRAEYIEGRIDMRGLSRLPVALH